MISQIEGGRTAPSFLACSARRKALAVRLCLSGQRERPVAEITAPELLAVLRKVEARGRYQTARRLRSTCGIVFRYPPLPAGAERDRSVERAGCVDCAKVIHRATIVDPAGIGALLRAIEDYDGLPLTKAALKLAPLLAHQEIGRCSACLHARSRVLARTRQDDAGLGRLSGGIERRRERHPVATRKCLRGCKPMSPRPSSRQVEGTHRALRESPF